MAWYRCGGNSSSPTPVITPTLLKKYSNGTTGTTTFTIDEDGTYLVVVVYSHNGSGSYSLPAGRTATYSGDFLVNGTKGMKLAVVDLVAGDVVSMTTSVGAWAANAKVVIKLPFSITGLVDSSTASDAVFNYTLSTGTGTVLAVMATWARQSNGTNLYDYSEIGDDSDTLAGVVGVNTLLRVFACEVSNFPTLKAYGYDGGGTTLAVLQ